MSETRNIKYGSEFNIYTYNVSNVKLLTELSKDNFHPNSVIINAENGSNKNDTYIDLAIIDSNGQGKSILPDNIVKYDDKRLSVISDDTYTKMLTSTFDKMYPEEYNILNGVSTDLYGIENFKELCTYWDAYNRLPYDFNVDKNLMFINAEGNKEIKNHLLDNKFNPYKCVEGDTIVIKEITFDNNVLSIKDLTYGFDNDGDNLNIKQYYEISGDTLKNKLTELISCITFEYDTPTNSNRYIDNDTIKSAFVKGLNTDSFFKFKQLETINNAIINIGIGIEISHNDVIQGDDGVKYSFDGCTFKANCTIGYLENNLLVTNADSDFLKNYVSEQPIEALDIKFKYPNVSGKLYSIFGTNNNQIVANENNWTLVINADKSSTEQNNPDNIIIYDNYTKGDKYTFTERSTTITPQFVKENSWDINWPMPLIASELKYDLACTLTSPIYNYDASNNQGNCPLQWLLTGSEEKPYKDVSGKGTFTLGNQYITLLNNSFERTSNNTYDNSVKINIVPVCRTLNENDSYKPQNILKDDGKYIMGARFYEDSEKTNGIYNFNIKLNNEETRQLYGSNVNFLNTVSKDSFICYFNELYNLGTTVDKTQSNYKSNYYLLDNTNSHNQSVLVKYTDDNKFEFTNVCFTDAKNSVYGNNLGASALPFVETDICAIPKDVFGNELNTRFANGNHVFFRYISDSSSSITLNVKINIKPTNGKQVSFIKLINGQKIPFCADTNFNSKFTYECKNLLKYKNNTIDSDSIATETWWCIGNINNSWHS